MDAEEAETLLYTSRMSDGERVLNIMIRNGFLHENSFWQVSSHMYRLMARVTGKACNVPETSIQVVAPNSPGRRLDVAAEEYVTLNASICNPCPLHAAAAFGNIQKLSSLLELGTIANVADRWGWSPCHFAVVSDELQCLKMLVEKKGDVSLRDIRGWDMIHMSAWCGHDEILKYILELRQIQDVDFFVGGESNPMPTMSPIQWERRLGMHVSQIHDKNILTAGGWRERIGLSSFTKNYYSCSPLHLAVLQNRVSTVSLLLSKNADPTKGGFGNCFPLTSAVALGLVHISRSLLNAIEPQFRQMHMAQPLTEAVAARNAGMLDLLLEFQCDVNLHWHDGPGATPLHYLTQLGAVNCVKVLMKYNAELAMADAFLRRPLDIAALHNEISIAQMLIEANANFDEPSAQGLKTPIHHAATKGHHEFVKFLLRLKATPNIPAEDGVTPILSATQGQHVMCVQYLIEGGAIVDPPNYRITPLRSAACIGNLEIVTMLLVANADPNFIFVPTYSSSSIVEQQNQNQQHPNQPQQPAASSSTSAPSAVKYSHTPLHFACCNGHSDVVERMLTHSADPNMPGEDGATPLHCAVSYGHALTARKLLRGGADVHAAAVGDRLPIHYAAYYGHAQCLALLLECQSDPNAPTADTPPERHSASTTEFSPSELRNVSIHDSPTSLISMPQPPQMVQIPLPGTTPGHERRRPARSPARQHVRRNSTRNSTLREVPESVDELQLTDNIPEATSPENSLRGTLEPPDFSRDVDNRMSQAVSTTINPTSPDASVSAAARSPSPPAWRRSHCILPPKKISTESLGTLVGRVARSSIPHLLSPPAIGFGLVPRAPPPPPLSHTCSDQEGDSDGPRHVIRPNSMRVQPKQSNDSSLLSLSSPLPKSGSDSMSLSSPEASPVRRLYPFPGAATSGGRELPPLRPSLTQPNYKFVFGTSPARGGTSGLGIAANVSSTVRGRERRGTLTSQGTSHDDSMSSINHAVQPTPSRGSSPRPRERGWCPLHYASMSGSEDSVRLLLAARADPAAKDRQGRTALRLAHDFCHFGVVRILRDHEHNHS